ncbi:unnamed protein product [Victoria cruziana]
MKKGDELMTGLMRQPMADGVAQGASEQQRMVAAEGDDGVNIDDGVEEGSDEMIWRRAMTGDTHRCGMGITRAAADDGGQGRRWHEQRRRCGGDQTRAVMILR